jgi:hypothetical protein
MHRRGIVNDNMTSQIGFFLKTFSVQPIGLGKQFPVNMFGAFTCIIHFMLGKFCRKSMKRTFVHSRNKAFHYLIGEQFQVLKTGYFFYLRFDLHIPNV